jgi:hypothetical protein
MTIYTHTETTLVGVVACVAVVVVVIIFIVVTVEELDAAIHGVEAIVTMTFHRSLTCTFTISTPRPAFHDRFRSFVYRWQNREYPPITHTQTCIERSIE